MDQFNLPTVAFQDGVEQQVVLPPTQGCTRSWPFARLQWGDPRGTMWHSGLRSAVAAWGDADFNNAESGSDRCAVQVRVTIADAAAPSRVG